MEFSWFLFRLVFSRATENNNSSRLRDLICSGIIIIIQPQCITEADEEEKKKRVGLYLVWIYSKTERTETIERVEKMRLFEKRVESILKDQSKPSLHCRIIKEVYCWWENVYKWERKKRSIVHFPFLIVVDIDFQIGWDNQAGTTTHTLSLIRPTSPAIILCGDQITPL